LDGLNIFKEGSSKVLEILKDRDMLLCTHKYKHKYPYDWRSKKPVIIRSTKQWFIGIEKLLPDLDAAIDNVEFIPSSGMPVSLSFHFINNLYDL
jgi:isoleucyl-tRNA synthetase